MKLEYNAEGDQWARDGDCSKCRRQKYCGSRCKKNVMRTERIIQGLFTRAIAERLHKVEEGSEE